MEEEFRSQWRASAHEAVPYTEDLPECLNILPEWIDGSIGQGKATCVCIDIKLLDQYNGQLRVRDNGTGIKNPQRLLNWAASESTDTHHRYGHGSKKCLTKWCKDYDEAKWYIRYRNVDKKGVSGSLMTYSYPFIGNKKVFEENEQDELNLMPSGTEWFIQFKREILTDKYKNPDSLFLVLKELIRTRYSKEHFDKTDFRISVSESGELIQESSKEKNWTCFEECLMKEVENGTAKIAYDEQIEFADGVQMIYKQYRLSEINGKTKFELKTEFPIYGNKNQKCSRIHISIQGRTIEIPYIWKFYKGKQNNHNDFNGYFGIVKFRSEHPDHFLKMPTPCTTKVSFYVNCPNYQKFKTCIMEIHEKEKIKSPLPTVMKEQKTSLVTILPDNVKSLVQDLKVKHAEISRPSQRKTKSISIPSGVRYDVWHHYIGKEIAAHKCMCCKLTTIYQQNFDCGHVISSKDGGNESIQNLRPICSKCNKSMGTKNMREYVIEYGYLIG